jgi:3-oxoacyl-[acyl-carrier protein] reductase
VNEDNHMTQFTHRVAVVTGSSSGIGRSIALELGAAGYSLVLHARQNLAGLQSVARQLQQLVPDVRDRVLCLTGDIACSRTCRDLVSAAFAWHGRVDVWVNNAGADVLTGQARSLCFEARLARLLDVDVQGTIRLCRQVAKMMSDQSPLASAAQGHSLAPAIINMSWDQANLGMEGEPGQLFCTTKAAVAAFTNALALSFPAVRVNCVAPGWIKTEWGQSVASEYWSQRATNESLSGRWGTPQDVAKAIGWLAADASQFINGQTVNVNGGRRFYPGPQL